MVRAPVNARTPKLIAIATIRSAKGRKLSGPLERSGIGPYAPKARPFRTRSQDMPFPGLQTPAAMVQTAAVSASLFKNTIVHEETVKGPSAGPLSYMNK